MTVLRRFTKRALQLILLIPAGLLVAVLAGMYVDNEQYPLVPSGRWLGWAGYTVLIAVFVIREKRKSWPHPTFWVVLASLFVAHTAAYAVAFQFVDTWRGIWFLPITLVEYPLLLSVLDRIGRSRRP